MIDRTHIERILKINGISPTAPNEVVREVLLSARFREDEIETALSVLRENVTTSEERSEGLHKIFRTDEVLKPKEIARLLGIDINLDMEELQRRRKRTLSIAHYIVIVALAVLIGFGILLYLMYNLGIGLFHPTAADAFSWPGSL